MVYESYRKCSRKECKVCNSGGQHGPYVYANVTDEHEKKQNLYIGKLGDEKSLKKAEEFDKKYPGILDEYMEILSNQNKVEYVEKRIDITEELDEKVYRAGLNIQELLITTLENKTKNIVLEKNWKSKRRRDKKI